VSALRDVTIFRGVSLLRDVTIPVGYLLPWFRFELLSLQPAVQSTFDKLPRATMVVNHKAISSLFMSMFCKDGGFPKNSTFLSVTPILQI
jgi:hypothetical protein